MTVLMPTDYTWVEKEAEGKRVCDSILTTVSHFKLDPPSTAVCDTDTNCEWYDMYKKFGVAKIFVAYDIGEEDGSMLRVECQGASISLYTNRVDSLKTICQQEK